MMCTTSGSFLVDIWELHTKRAVKSCGKHYVENNILINKPIYIYTMDYHGLFIRGVHCKQYKATSTVSFSTSPQGAIHPWLSSAVFNVMPNGVECS